MAPKNSCASEVNHSRYERKLLLFGYICRVPDFHLIKTLMFCMVEGALCLGGDGSVILKYNNNQERKQ